MIGELTSSKPAATSRPRLEATVVYLKHEQHLSYERGTQVCRDLFGVEVSEGASAMLRRADTVAQLVGATIGVQVSQSAVIGSDETSARAAGRNGWQESVDRQRNNKGKSISGRQLRRLNQPGERPA